MDFIVDHWKPVLAALNPLSAQKASGRFEEGNKMYH